MHPAKNQRRATLSWLSVAMLLVLCGVLGYLQYRWIGEVSATAHERLRGSLQANLNRISQEFNFEISAACRAIVPAGPQPDAVAAESEITARYGQWKQTARQGQLFSRIALAVPQAGTVVLRSLDPRSGSFQAAEWPPEWDELRRGFESRLRISRLGSPSSGSPTVFEFPLMTAFPEMPPAGMPRGPFPRREAAWVIFELSLPYIREVMLPELVQLHLGSDYQVAVLARTVGLPVIYESDPNQARQVSSSADASIGLFQPPNFGFGPPGMMRPPDRGPGGGPGPDFAPRQPPGGPGRGPARGPGPGFGRWQLFVRHRAGSLEAVVAQARWRNLAVTGGVLVLMLASIGALMRYTRRAQKLAELQMDFVAGVSHELRTPLTVIHTAAYNLRGGLAQSPGQVEKYGALIQQESARLKELVEQVLRFASADKGRVIQAPEPLSVQAVIEESLESSKEVIQEARCVVEKKIDAGLPLILGDSAALQQALQNLLSNAAKYGTDGNNWIGVFASRASGPPEMVEIRVADHGPGIPPDEQTHIFDPFFRGKRAVQDQVHGTGLGLNLVKKIVEAHGGSIRVQSEPAKGTEFIVQIPAAPGGAAA